MATQYDRRSATRLPFQTVVELYWTTVEGAEVRERVRTEDVCRTGALLRLQDYWKDLYPGCEVYKVNSVGSLNGIVCRR
jgi:hypothetical protein